MKSLEDRHCEWQVLLDIIIFKKIELVYNLSSPA